MSSFILGEFSNLLEGAWYGLCIAAAYDVLRIIRRVIHFGKWQVGIQDFVFWTAVGFVVFAMIFECNDGIVRGYILVATWVGAYLYHISVSHFLVKNLSKFFHIIFTILLKKPIKWSKIIVIRLFKMVFLPFRIVLIWIKNRFKGGYIINGKHNDKKKEKREVGNTGH